ncbi:hypothetical protein [Streptomyces sp. KAU_LT]|uniref:hypothetical protein n=1 Tax=Streptomyces sp. KAU_LT TaxID=3046669 RepID=UPI0024B700ED|nr:hypothetical protein [Streptomyces sp. KAU_LT]MDI9831729.1 hypothetical protein [Streptomyces sp. KAU_LT]
MDDEDLDGSPCCSGMPGMCSGDEGDRQPHVRVERPRRQEGWVLRAVDAYAGGMGADPSWDLGDDLPPGFHARTLRELTVLVETAGRKLEAEQWYAYGPWQVLWTSCTSPVAGAPAGGHVSVRDDGTVQVRLGKRGRVVHEASVPQDAASLEGLHSLLRRVTEVVGEAGYGTDGEWTVDWSRCQVDLDD